MDAMTVVKLGGSVVTEKSKPLSFRRDVVVRLARELKQSHVSPLILVHGGGSFGHPVAQEHRIKGGLERADQIPGFARTVLQMRDLNGRIVEVANELGVRAVGFPGSTMFVTEKGRIASASLDAFLSCLEARMTPVTCGDAVFDRAKTFTILSGDQIAVYLSIRLKAQRLIFLVDVDGVYTFNPATQERVLIPAYHGSERLVPLEGGGQEDVTGGIVGKLDEALAAAERGIEVYVANGLVPGRLLDLLSSRKTICTRISP